METILRYYPVLLIDVAVGVIGFGMGAARWKNSGRELDRDALIFMAKMWGANHAIWNVDGLCDVADVLPIFSPKRWKH